MAVVNTLIDEFDGSILDGDASLRDAIFAARVNETIIFQSSLDGGTISLAQALRELVINKSLEIDATSLPNGLTIDAGNGADHTFGTGDGFRIFNVDDGVAGPTIDVSISGLTLTGGDTGSGFGDGDDGGAIFSWENLAVTACTISNNSADFHGGGLFNSRGNLTVTASTISGNSAYLGGGIFTDTDSNFLTTQTQILNSTISANEASFGGGGIYNINGLTVIQFSTITENLAPVDEGSGIASYGDTQTLTAVYSSIIAGNLGSDVDFVEDLSNTFDSAGFNLIGAGNATGAFARVGTRSSARPIRFLAHWRTMADRPGHTPSCPAARPRTRVTRVPRRDLTSAVNRSSGSMAASSMSAPTSISRWR